MLVFIVGGSFDFIVFLDYVSFELFVLVIYGFIVFFMGILIVWMVMDY